MTEVGAKELREDTAIAKQNDRKDNKKLEEEEEQSTLSLCLSPDILSALSHHPGFRKSLEGTVGVRSV